jgi:hypothetical protein
MTRGIVVVLAAVVVAALATGAFGRAYGGGEAYESFGITKRYPYWGWSNNTGLRCRNPDNTGCNTEWVNGQLVEKDPVVHSGDDKLRGRNGLFDKGGSMTERYPYWGWGANAGLRCRNPDNTGCNTRWVKGKLVESR